MDFAGVMDAWLRSRIDMPKPSMATPTTSPAATNKPRNPNPTKSSKSSHPQGERKSSGTATSNCGRIGGGIGSSGGVIGADPAASKIGGGAFSDTSLTGARTGAAPDGLESSWIIAARRDAFTTVTALRIARKSAELIELAAAVPYCANACSSLCQMGSVRDGFAVTFHESQVTSHQSRSSQCVMA